MAAKEPTYSMMDPTIEELSKGKYNRYTLVIATAKCARTVTDEYVKQRENAEKMIANKETDKPISSMIRKEYRDEKAVRTAINRLDSGEYKIIDESISSII
ncbi:MAG: DNA-directed RNA polymerase subunit omega [Clostridia bacterium]|nr:DNA-directed RNA polymerase subunit omega [Clostridia bacterium]